MVSACLRPLKGNKATSKPVLLGLRSSRTFIMAVVVYSVFTDIFLYGVIVPVAPTALVERVGLSPDEVQRWTSILLALYGAALLVSAPAAGYIADRVQSRRWPFLMGLVALSAATGILCAGTSLALWIIGRIFQGISAAVVWTVGLALLVDTIGKEGIGQAMGYAGMAVTFGTLAGPLLGGVVYGRGGYSAVFGMSFALIGLDILLRVVMIERKHAIRWLETEKVSVEPTDEEKVGGLVESKTEADIAISEGTDSGQGRDGGEEKTEPQRETESDSSKAKYGPAFTLLSSERILVTIWAYFIISLILTSFDSVLPIFTEVTFQWNQVAQGIIFIPLNLPHLIDPLMGYVIDHYPFTRRYLGAAGFFSAVPFFVLLRLINHNTIDQKVLLCVFLALVGGCLAVAIIPLMVEITYAVLEKEEETPDIFGRGGAMALAYGLLNAAFAAGSVLGPFFAGFIRESAGWGTMTWALALITGVSAVPVLLFVDGPIWKRRRNRS